jgi:glycosyltransferase involved in cell wall biosynthesis
MTDAEDSEPHLTDGPQSPDDQAEGAAASRRLAYRVARQDELIASLRGEIHALTERLRAIEESRAWGLIRQVWRTRKLIAQPRTSLVRTATKLAGRVAAGPSQVSAPPIRPSGQATPRPATRPTTTESAAEPATGPTGDRQPPGAGRYDVVCLAVIEWSYRRARPQQLMRQFAEQGHRVFYVSPEHTYSATVNTYAVESIAPGLYNVALTLQAPLDVHGAARQTVAERRRFEQAATEALAALRADYGIEGAVCMVQIPTWAPAAYACRDRFGWKIVYDCMDDLETFDGFGPTAVIEERALVSRADLLVVTSQYLYRKLSPDQMACVLVRNGADFEHFNGIRRVGTANQTAGAADRPVGEGAPNARNCDGPAGDGDETEVGQKTVGYFGAISSWFDVEIVRHLAESRPSYRVVLVGSVYQADVEGLRALLNVELIGEQPYASLPAYLAQFSVCLIPFKITPLIEATDPVKLYEYFSQGKPVVSTDLPEVRPYGDLLYVARSPAEFLAQVDLALAEHDPGLTERRLDLARSATWESRYRELHAAIRGIYPPVGVVAARLDGPAAPSDPERLARLLTYPGASVVAAGTGRIGESAATEPSRVDRPTRDVESTHDAEMQMVPRDVATSRDEDVLARLADLARHQSCAYVDAGRPGDVRRLDGLLFQMAGGAYALSMLTSPVPDGSATGHAQRRIVGAVLTPRLLDANGGIDRQYETLDFAVQSLLMQANQRGWRVLIETVADELNGDDLPDDRDAEAADRDRWRFEHQWHVRWTDGWFDQSPSELG